MIISVVPTTEAHFAGFHAVVDAVARERKYLGFTEAPSVEQTATFVRGLLADGGLQFLAITEANEVVGWCDVARLPWEGLRHVGKLGMGLLPRYRGQGYGRQLAEAGIEAAQKAGLERIELEVFASNLRAIKLYETLGFRQEGIKKRFRKLDSTYDDNIVMAIVNAQGG